MKILIGIALFVLIIIIFANLDFTNSEKPCHKNAWFADHVHKPARLEVLDKCKTVSGLVDVIFLERDGDLHVHIKLDPKYAHLVNQANHDKQRGNLVVEFICVTPSKDKVVTAACKGFTNLFAMPKMGDHITLTGQYVLDTPHGWTEIHPVYEYTINTKGPEKYDWICK